jgi:AcrR family transcriptional regulator
MGDIQRALILSAMVAVCSDCGAANVTVARVVAHAGISRRTFYEQFESCEECLLSALDDAILAAGERIVAAWDASRPWTERVRAALTALLRFLDEEPAIARLLVVESLAAGPKALGCHSRAIARLLPAIDAGRAESTENRALASVTAEGTAGAVLFVLHRRMVDLRTPRLMELVNPLMAMIVLPYLGTAAASAELAQPKEASPKHRKATYDPLRLLNIRLTYRTMRVLTAIGAQPGSSNRQIGRVAGVEDAGQMSKLLARLRELELIANTGALVKGTPNSWSLTLKGTEVHDAIVAGTLPGLS